MSARRPLPAWAIGAILGIGAAVVWGAAGELAWPARALTVVLVAVLPALLAGQARIGTKEAAAVSTTGVYITSMLSVWAMALLAAAAGLGSGFSADLMGLSPVEPAPCLLWAGGITGFALLVLVAGRLVGQRESPLVERLIPRTSRERVLFVLVCLSAGIGEELVFRGFLIPALHAASGSIWTAALVSGVAFGMLHSYQRVGGVLRATALGIALAAPFIATGSLIPSMVAHAMIDLIAGLGPAEWLMKPTREGSGNGPD